MFTVGQKIEITAGPPSIGATVASYWVGKIATFVCWEGDNWCTVECEGKKLLLRESEFKELP